MKNNHIVKKEPGSIKVIQFGEGNFLRAFFDDLVEKENSISQQNNKVVIIKPRPGGNLNFYYEQDNRFTVVTRGIKNDAIYSEHQYITCIDDVIDPYESYNKFIALAEVESLNIVVSNTTEEGIKYRSEDKFSDCPCLSYPGKLTQFLFKRYEHFNGDQSTGLTILPTELVDDNGKVLKEIILVHSKEWGLPKGFISWINDACNFCDTLVDRIVSGFPDDAEEIMNIIGYEDKLIVVCEPYRLFVIKPENNEKIKNDLNVSDTKISDELGIVISDNIKKYRERKVRILNGGHTGLVMTGLLYKKNNVMDCMKDDILKKFLSKLIYSEIIPATHNKDGFSEDELTIFADSVMERFKNPFLNHHLTSIATNSVSKWKNRLLPTLKDYMCRHKKIPSCISFSLAALIAYYNGNKDSIDDESGIVSFLKKNKNDMVHECLANVLFWGEDLTQIQGFEKSVSHYFEGIQTTGICNTLTELINSIKIINETDNVAVALKDIDYGEVLTLPDKDRIITKSEVKKGHKVCISPILSGEKIIKYGEAIGVAVEDVSAGELVHTHNLKSSIPVSRMYSYGINPENRSTPFDICDTFWGYERENGTVGTRNDIWIIPTVNCVNKTARAIAIKADKKTGVDDIVVCEHPYGCSQLGSDMENTANILRGLIKHPNAGGVLLVGLGCENISANYLLSKIGDEYLGKIRVLICQDEEDEINKGLVYLDELQKSVSGKRRTKQDMSNLIVGLKCGGSDAFSGITANPLTGQYSDALLKIGATPVLAEIPEMFGAEHLLLSRCVDEKCYTKYIDMVNDFKKYYTGNGQKIDENPSPGNKDGGITTLAEKSLGCVTKGGQGKIKDVVTYGKTIDHRTVAGKEGLIVLETPGNDLISITAMLVAGAQIILFTTGRGTPAGSLVPTVKISSNKEVYDKKRNWIDIDSTSTDLNEMAESINMILSGEKKTCNELNGYKEISIWKKGVTL